MSSDTKRHALLRSLVALLCAFALGCSVLGDQTDEANKLVDEVNALKERAAALDKQADAKEQEISPLNVLAERERINALSKEQADLYKQSADLYREGADKAEQASKLKVDDWFKDYLTLKAQQLRKTAEITDVQRRQAEVWLGGQDFDGVKTEMGKLNDELKKLSAEMNEMNARVQKAEEDNKDKMKK